MTSRTRLLVLSVTAPVIAFAVIGGLLGKTWAREETYQHLRVFEDVVSLISGNYVEDANLARVMRGAMRGLAEGLDPDSAYLAPDEAKQHESSEKPAGGETGIELTRTYYLRVIAARDGSPAARAGLQSGDFLRAIDGKPTREMSVYEGTRLLRGAPGTKVSLLVIRGNVVDPHAVEITREILSATDVTGRMEGATMGYVRIAGFGPTVAKSLGSQVNELTRAGATSLLVDVRDTATGCRAAPRISLIAIVPAGTNSFAAAIPDS